MEENRTSNEFRFFVSFYWAKRYENRRIMHPFALIAIVTSPHFIHEHKSEKNTKQEQNEKKNLFEKLNNESRKPIVTWFIVHTAR